MVTCTGWTWDYVEEELDIPRLQALNEYWRECPPVHLLVKGFVGYKAKSKSPYADTVNDPAELAALFNMLTPVS